MKRRTLPIFFSRSIFRKEGCLSLWQNTNQVCTSTAEEDEEEGKNFILVFSLSRGLVTNHRTTAAAAVGPLVDFATGQHD